MKTVLTFFGLSFSALLPLINPLGDALIAAANANGGEDNISALILDVTD